MIDSKAKIRDTALGMLSRREHSQKELLNKLKARDYLDTDISAVLATLKKQGLQSDCRYTEAYINSRVNKGYGPVRIAQELKQRGIAEESARDYLYAGTIDWQALTAAARRKKFGDAAVEDNKERSKQYRFLQYRGFSGEHIRACFRQIK